MSIRFRRAVGIDLGTTNSEIAMVPPSERSIWLYADRFGRKTVASAVAWDEQEQGFVVGNPARARRANPVPPIESIKRKMGSKETVAIGPQQLLPEEISAKILGELATRMREFMATRRDEGVVELQDAVITVPAYFDAPQVEATRRAAELAGIGVLAILQEPTAAAIYHVWRAPALAESSHFLVYDLGGGTFDVSILRAVDGEYQVLAVDGDNFLGGDDLDRRFAEHLRELLVQRGYALDLDVRGNEEDRIRFARLTHVAQEIKEALSRSEVASIASSKALLDQRGEPVAIEAEFGRAEYEDIVRGFVDTTLRACERALARSQEAFGVGLADIDHVILVGGSTRVPLVERMVRRELAEHTKSKTMLVSEVDACVAMGAAVHAAVLGGTRYFGSNDASVSVLSSLASRSREVRLALRPDAPLPEGATTLAIWSGDEPIAQTALSKAQAATAPLRVSIPLPEGDRSSVPLTAAYQSALGTPLAEIPFEIHRSDEKPRPSKLTRASVLAKDISVEVIRGQSRERRVLLARGTGLPARSSQLFYTADQSGSVVLPLLQDRLPLDTLMIEIDKQTKVGAPVELTITCDEAMRIEASAEVAGRQVKATVTPTESSGPVAADQVEALLAEAERSRHSFLGQEGKMIGEEVDWLVFGIREAFRIDPDKLDALCRRLRGILDEHGSVPGEGLQPALHTFEQTLARTRRTALSMEGDAAGLSKDEWLVRIETLEKRARQAFEAADSARWTRINEELQAVYETLTIERLNIVSVSDPKYADRLAFGISVRIAELERKLGSLEVDGDAELRRLRQAELVRIATWLTSDVQPRLAAVKEKRSGGATVADSVQELSEMDHELERIEHAIARVPQLGLSTDRGRGT